MQEIYTKILDGRYDLTHAYSADEAWSHLQKNKPDLIILDIMMPGECGDSLCLKIRSMHQYAKVPVIVVSIIRESVQVIKMLGLSGQVSWMEKPFDEQKLLKKIEQLTNK